MKKKKKLLSKNTNVDVVKRDKIHDNDHPDHYVFIYAPRLMLMMPQSSYRLRYQITRRNSIFCAWRNKRYRQLTPQLCWFNQYKGSAEGFSRGFSRAKQTAGSIRSAEFAEAVWVKKEGSPVPRNPAKQNQTKQKNPSVSAFRTA